MSARFRDGEFLRKGPTDVFALPGKRRCQEPGPYKVCCYPVEPSDNALFFIAQDHAFFAGTGGTFISSATPASLRHNTALLTLSTYRPEYFHIRLI